MRPRWLEGVWLGQRFFSGEHVVAMADGRMVRAGNVQAMAEEVRWKKEAILGIKGLPWQPTGTVLRRPD